MGSQTLQRGKSRVERKGMKMLVIDHLKESLQWIFRSLGFEVYRLWRINQGGFSYEPVKPLATYAPWLTDPVFNQIFGAIKDHTYVDRYRCYELWTLVEQSSKLDRGALLEVGVWRGGSGALIATKAKSIGISDTIYLCDTFTGVVKAGSKDETFYKGGEHADTSSELVEQFIRDTLGLENVIVLKGIFPDETAGMIPITWFRFCHIDVDTYQSAKDVLEWVWGKLLVGGIVIFDDYGFRYCEGVTKLVEELRGLPDRLLIHNLNGHAILIKTHG
jgi:O-methyltransferase